MSLKAILSPRGNLFKIIKPTVDFIFNQVVGVFVLKGPRTYSLKNIFMINKINIRR